MDGRTRRVGLASRADGIVMHVMAFEEPLLQKHDFQFQIHELKLAGEVDLEAMFPFLR